MDVTEVVTADDNFSAEAAELTKLKEVLESARKMLETRWCRNNFYANGRVCALGALSVAHKQTTGQHLTGVQYATQLGARRFNDDPTARKLGCLLGFENPDNIPAWNDRQVTGSKEVRARFDQAIGKIDEALKDDET